jgi:hypothetical protein
MQRDNLEWLDDWYQSQCDGVWEHSRGMRLESLADSGWRLTIHLAGTSAANARPQRINLDTPCGEWIDCSISENRFQGSGDPRKLEKIIGVFRQWVDAGT